MKSKKVAVLSALALALGLGLMIFSATSNSAKAAMAVCSVPGTHATIQDAVNDLSCTTINVSAGTYPESVTIARPLTLNGPNAGVSALAARSPEATVTSAVTTFNLTTSTGVTIDGFTINGDFGIYAALNADGVMIADNIVTGTTRALSLDGTANNPSVLDNELISNVRSLHVSAGPWTNMKMNGNRFSGNGSIFFSGALSNSIAGFEFKDNEVLHEANIASNISNGDVSGNTFNAAVGSSLDLQISLHNSTMTGNTFEGNNSNACLQIFGSQFGLVPSDQVLVSGNTFNNCGSAVLPWTFAVQLSPDITNITITNNDITDSFEGVNTRDSTVWTVSPTVHVNLNNITGSTNFGVRNGQMGVLNATCNWWGAANGPGPVGPGSGDKVSTNVNFTPWQIAPDGACIGGNVPTTASQCKNGGWTTRVRANGSTFKNQGDCIQYVNTGK
ncbi:MAG: right-handed parallel beta-helix repeat-containing protein [Pyrinomonadaceae bacterium]